MAFSETLSTRIYIPILHCCRDIFFKQALNVLMSVNDTKVINYSKLTTFK